MSNKTIYFRADGNHEIGLGHIYRVISLKEMLEQHFECVFLLKDSNREILSILQNSFSTIKFIPDFSSTREEAEYIADNYPLKNQLAVLDGYHFNNTYQGILKKEGCKLISIDDLHQDEFQSDLIINHGSGAKKEDYITKPYSKLLLGVNYLIQRKVFLDAAKNNPSQSSLENIFICFGGSDYHNLSLKIAQFCEKSNSISNAIVVTGKAYSGNNELEKLTKVSLFHNLSAEELLDKMRLCSIAIAPASGISYELISSKTGLISGFYTNNQLDILKGLDESKSIFNVGDFRTLNYDFFEKALLQLQDINYLSQQLHNQQTFIDGNSGERILAEFLELSES